MPKHKETITASMPIDSAGEELNDDPEFVKMPTEELQVNSEAASASNGGIDFDRFADPFGKDISNGKLFRHRQLEELQPLLCTCISEQSMALITGPSGSGKTTALRSITDELPTNKYSVIYLGQDQDGTNLLTRFVSCLGVQPKRYRPRLAMQISQWLLDNLDASGKQLTLIVDEAHLLDSVILEDFRLMTNADYDRKSPLTVILLGQPILRQRLKSSQFEALRQRLRYRYCLEGLDQDETSSYIQHKLSSAGLASNLFTAEALQFIFQITEGLPRRINNVCSLALLQAAIKHISAIELPFLKQLADLD